MSFWGHMIVYTSKNGKKTLWTDLMLSFTNTTSDSTEEHKMLLLIKKHDSCHQNLIFYQELLIFGFILHLSQKVALLNKASIFPINWQMKQSPPSCKQSMMMLIKTTRIIKTHTIIQVYFSVWSIHGIPFASQSFLISMLSWHITCKCSMKFIWAVLIRTHSGKSENW